MIYKRNDNASDDVGVDVEPVDCLFGRDIGAFVIDTCRSVISGDGCSALRNRVSLSPKTKNERWRIESKDAK